MFSEKNRVLIVAIAFVLFIPTVAFSSSFVVFIPQWRPQAQFAGYYMAYKKGFYKKYGLNVKILTGGPDAPSTEYLKGKKVDFATMWLSTAIKMKAEGVDLINVAQIFQRSSLAIVAWKSKVKTIKDLDGIKIGVWGASFMAPLRAFMKKYNLKMNVVPHMGSINLFLRGGVDAATAMWYNEYNTIINSGVEPKELSVFLFYKYGLNFPEDGIYVLKSTYLKHPKMCRDFVKASIKGWLYAFKHPKEAVNVVLQYMYKAHVPANKAHQEWMLNAVKNAFFYNGKKGIGVLKKSDYYYVAKILKQEGLINSIPAFKDFYRNCYVSH